MIGTSIKNIKVIINDGIISFFKNSVSRTEIKIMINNAKTVNDKCFVKKSNNLY